MKLVIDANILVAAYITRGKVARAWRGRLAAHTLVISPEILLDVETTLRRRDLRVSPPTVTAILRDILARCQVLRTRARFEVPLPDERHRGLANLCVEAEADGVVTSNRPLLAVGTLRGTVIWSLERLLKVMRAAP